MIETGEIKSTEKLTGAHEIYKFTVFSPEIARSAAPGQFLMVKCEGFTLRRPISICSISGDNLIICFEVRGEGTKYLAGLKTGDTMDILGPLGKGFDISNQNLNVLLAGGGIGIYPLYAVAEAYKEKASAVLGFRSKSLMNMTADFADCGADVRIATDDGSFGHKGYVIDLVREVLDSKQIDIIMTCGPKIMMRGIAEEAQKRGIRCLVSMEERMACGVGACLACVCRSSEKDEHSQVNKKRVCLDGPVFESTEVIFDE